MTLEVDVTCHRDGFELHARLNCAAGVTALFGPSGAGKTSIINMIGGLLKPASGHIMMDGHALFDSQRRINVVARKRRIGYIFQEGRLFPHLKVRNNLLYGQRFVPADERFADFGHIVEMLGIGHLLERRPPRLSGGERQRVAIGRALLSSPRLLLMDEPLASLDAARKNDILPYIERLRDELAIPIIYVSHQFEEVARLADQLVVLDQGRVLAAGSVADVASRAQPDALSGLDYAGAVIEARITAQEDEYGLTHVRCGNGELVVPQVALPVGSPVRIRIHGSDVVIATQPPQGLSIQNSLPGRIVEINTGLGASGSVRLDVGGVFITAHLTRKAIDALDLAVGLDVHVLIKSMALARPVPK